MFYFLFFIIGLAGGAFCMFLLVQYRYRKATEEKRSQHARKQKLEQELHELTEKRKRFEAVLNEFKQRIASYEQLQGENTILKRDLRNIDVGLRKSQLDVQVQARRQKELDERVNTLCWQYVKDSIKWLTKSLTQNNFVSIKERLIHIIEGCRRIGFDIPNEQETVYVSNLKEEFEKTETQVGEARMKEAIDWALLSGISNIKSILTAAKKGGSHAGREQGRGPEAHRGDTGKGGKFSGFHAIESGPGQDDRDED